MTQQDTNPTVTTKPDLFRQLPSVDELLRVPALQEMMHRFGHTATVEASREFIDDLREKISARFA